MTETPFHRRFVRLPNPNSVYDPYLNYPFGFSAGTGLWNPRDERAAAAFMGSVLMWCTQECGIEHDRWVNHGAMFRFRNAADATAFFLRWG